MKGGVRKGTALFLVLLLLGYYQRWLYVPLLEKINSSWNNGVFEDALIDQEERTFSLKLRPSQLGKSSSTRKGRPPPPTVDPLVQKEADQLSELLQRRLEDTQRGQNLKLLSRGCKGPKLLCGSPIGKDQRTCHNESRISNYPRFQIAVLDVRSGMSGHASWLRISWTGRWYLTGPIGPTMRYLGMTCSSLLDCRNALWTMKRQEFCGPQRGFRYHSQVWSYDINLWSNIKIKSQMSLIVSFRNEIHSVQFWCSGFEGVQKQAETPAS